MFEAGQIVKLTEPSEAERAIVFTVIEMRGPRVLVRDDTSHMAIKPTFVYLAAELAIASEADQDEAEALRIVELERVAYWGQ